MPSRSDTEARKRSRYTSPDPLRNAVSRFRVSITAVPFPLALVAVVAWLALFTATAHARCRTHRCWHKVHVHRLERMVERRIRAVAPLRCYGQPSAVPCWIITRESRGSWTAWNPQAVHGFHARGFYQLLGHGEPWPVIVRSRYETLKRKLAHHRIAHELWREQCAGEARHW